MSTPTEAKTILDASGAPAYVVVPVAEYEALVAKARAVDRRRKIPHEVVGLMITGYSPARAWREHLGLTQSEVARRMGITQPALAQIEAAGRPRKATRTRLAAALGLSISQLVVP